MSRTKISWRVEAEMRPRRLVARSVLAGLCLAPAAAAAQDNRYTLPSGQARALVARYAACVVRARTADVQAVLVAWEPGRGDSRLPVLEECAHNVPYSTTEVSFSGAAYRHAMAEALYVVRYGAAAPWSYDGVPLSAPAEVRAPANPSAAIRAAYDEAVAERYRLIIGDCVVRTGPGATHALLTSAVGTPAEATAFGAIQPVLAQCLPSGQTARFNRSSLRGILAIAALRLNAAARATALHSGGTH